MTREKAEIEMRKIPLILAATICAALAMTTPAQAHPAVGKYVALGDSFAAEGDLTDLTGPLTCLRSRESYPSFIAAALAPTRFVDNTCSGATAGKLVGTQFDGLTADTDLVTLTIGVNDLDPVGTLGPCVMASLTETAFTPSAGNPCERQYTSAGVDTLALRIESELRPIISGVLNSIRERAPEATIVMLNYPALYPPTTAECGYWHGVARGDVPYIYRTIRHIALVLVEEAVKVGALGVDANAITGHDACQTTDKRWVEALVTTAPTLPFHPNPLGTRAMADLVLAALGR